MNVNGDLEKKIEDPVFIEFFNGNDIILLNECWINKTNDLRMDGYADPICKFRKKKKGAKRDSGGLCCFIRNSIIKGVTEVSWDFEDGLCLKMDRLFFGWERDAYILFVYMKPISSSRGDLDIGVDGFETLENKIAEVSEMGNVMCLGDFNARVSERDECIILKGNEETNFNEIMGCVLNVQDKVFEEYDFSVNNMSIKRVNEDKHVNSYGLKILSICRACDLAILNGRAGADKGVGKNYFLRSSGSEY